MTAQQSDDLVQNTILRAFEKSSMFKPGTNLNAWLFTILKHSFFNEHRKRSREVPDSDGAFAAQLMSPPEQLGTLDLQDLWSALDQLPTPQRQVLMLVGVDGLSYEEAAEACGCSLGTIKSRMSRARGRLVELLG